MATGESVDSRGAALGAVRWGIAAFHANPGAGDAELTRILAAAGVPRAGHVVAMLPLAYGRRILDGLVELPTTFCEIDDAGEVARESALADDPIFAAADRLARSEATRKDLDRIGLVSSEVNAVNNALHAGSKPENLMMSSPMMRLGPDDPPGTPPLADAQAMLDALVAGHGATLALAARIFPGSVMMERVQLQLDVVATAGEREVVESFAGLGRTIAAAYGDAVNKLARGSLHPLLAVLDRRELGADQVDWERWGGWDVCLGPLLRMWSDAAPGRLGDFLDAVKTALLAAELAPGVHWVRTFVAIGADGKILAFDMLLDNDPWPPGVAIVESWKWPMPTDGKAYALRHFFMLAPVRE